jgi:5'/3'-nucleotidase SurE
MSTVSGTNIRFAQFNASLNRNADGQLINDLSNPAIPDTRAIGAPENPNRNQALRVQQAKNAAEIIQRNNPDVLLINEFDFNTANPTKAVELFINNFLKVGQNGAAPVDYKYFYIAPSNTGIPSGFDLNNNGSTVTTLTDGIGDNGYGDDSFGFGNFPGQFGMVVLSKYEIDTANVRTFQNFLWKDMPGNLLTNDPTVDNPATTVNENLNGFYSAAEIDKLRLSSKSHWDVPIKVNGEIVHALVSHPTPPVFDGTEDRNGKRNSDEIRFWADYVSPGQGGYIYDDKGGRGGLAGGSSFVIMGDQNADPRDGDSFKNAISQLLGNPNINTNSIPTSAGGPQQAALQGLINNTQTGNPAFDTADFADSGTNPGNLRTDYVLPSADLRINNSGVFWPLNTDPTFAPVGVFNPALPGGYAASDHRLVFADVQVGVTPSGKSIASAGLIGQKTFATGVIPAGAAGKIDGVDVPLGGLSGVTYDPAKNQYYAISDDRTPNARFYTFTLNPVNGDVTFTNVVQLKDATGKPFALNSLDPEGIALTATGTVFISSEGEANPAAGRVSNPFIKEFSLTTGQEIRSLAVPTKFLPKVTDTNGNGIVDAPDTQTAGVRNNLAFESLTISPDKKTLYTATENSLFQDGAVASTTTGTNSRIVQYNLVTGQPEKEYLYQTDKVALAPIPATAFATNGLVDLLAIDDRGTMLALERSFSTGVPGTGNTIKIYEISLQGATDISAIDSLASLTPAQLAALQPVSKRLVLNLDDLKLSTGLDNVEGLAFGPKLADGRQSIVLVSDNNFSATQFTQVITLGADLVPTATPTVETPSVLDAAAPFTAKPLNILLVNDDGYQALGLDKIYTALVAAGHKVTIVAPKADQSGIGTAIDTSKIFRPIEVVNYAPSKWYVDGTPVTTTLAALDSILKTTPPDLVISGINRGENTGNTAVSSGTVSAAIAAIQKGIPAIAISAGIDRAEAAQGFPSTTRAYELGAQYVVDLIAELQASQGNNSALLPAGKGLNINVPIGSSVKGVAYTEFDGTASLGFTFGALPNNSAAQGLLVTSGSLPPNGVPNPTSEGQQFIAGRLTVTPLDGSWNTTAEVRQAIDNRVNDGVTPPAGRSLKIMLVNDDGYQAAGIQKLYAGLVAAGHQVTIVAPKVDQSGRGTSINTDRVQQPMEVVNVSPNQWYVDGTPFVASIAGIDSILKNARPDLVISGINQGENIGNTATSSGTVGAAVAALQRGIPAISVSAGILLSESSTGFPSTQKVYDVATSYIVNLVGQLQATQGSGSLLPTGVGLNVNVPVSSTPLTTAFTEFDSATSLAIGFGAVTGGTGLTVVPQSPVTNPKPFSEGEQFLAGKITVTPFDGDWSSSDRDRELVADGLSRFVTGDADDPAVWIDPRNSGNSLILASLKNGGLVTLDLDGTIVQDLTARPYGSLRYNNVDVLYNFKLGNQTVDLAVATDRQNDTLAIFKIDPTTRQLVEVTDPSTAKIFQAAPFAAPYSASSISAYGLALYRSPVSGDHYAFTSRRTTGDVAQLKLVDKGNGKIGYELVRNFTVPSPTTTGATPQTEGMVADQETGQLYIGQEDVGIWKYDAEPNGRSTGLLIDKVKAEGGKNLTNDVEGLTIYYGKNGTGYLLASSQGDNTFAAYAREGSNNFIGRFGVGNNGSIDSVQESDGAEVINVPLGANFPNGLFITQDGSNDPAKIVAGENISSNFKLVPFENIANTFATPLTIDTTSYNPRNPIARPQALAQAANLVSGTTGADNLVAGVAGFDGINDIVFAGAGNDSVDIPIAGANAGNNRIDLGSGNDIIYVGNLDRAFGSTGDDIFEAGDAKDYRISGGAGNDTLFLGSNGRALGGEGNDKFYVGTGGSNLLSGGAGADQFWIYNGEAPASANTIVDFQIGTDVLGISGGVKFTDLTRTGNNISIGGNTIATLTGVDTTTLTATNFAFG